jgi:Flp pilus assembly protein TadG
LKTAQRRGAAAVELALCLPVLLLLFFGALECCNMAFLNQTLSVAGYEGVRHAIQFNATNQTAMQHSEVVLTARNVNGATVSFDPPDVSAVAAGTWITVTVSAPCDQNSGTPLRFFNGRTITTTSTMVKE